jgi:putative transposase
MRKRILMLQKKIRKYQSILDKGTNKKGKKIRHKNKLRNRIRGYYRRISNIVKELHTKAILYLCRNYKRIMIPQLEIKKIIKNVNKEIKDLSKELKENLNKERTEEKRNKIRKLKNQRRLKKGYKFSLQMLSHYKFIERLESKAREYGTKIIKVTEEYTTLTCTFCGNIKDDIDKTKRIKKCSKCGYTINRDINGARNILIKNIKKISKRL